MLRKSYLCGARRMGYVDYRKMTTGFVFPGWKGRARNAPTERRGYRVGRGRSEYNDGNGVERPRRSVALHGRPAIELCARSGDRRSSYVRGRETGAQQMAALTARGYNAEAKAGVDVMKGFLYICGGEVGTS
jgi:hypothetical protein